MSTAHKIAITVVVLFIGLAATPAAVTAVEFPSNDADWQKSYSSNDDANGGCERRVADNNVGGIAFIGSRLVERVC